MVIHEGQRALDLTQAIKRRVDRARNSGQYLLTGRRGVLTSLPSGSPVRRTTTAYTAGARRTDTRLDLLLVRGEELIAFEVKATTRVERADWAGIEACEEALGKRIRFSVALYRGDQVVGVAPKRLAVPLKTAFLGR